MGQILPLPHPVYLCFRYLNYKHHRSDLSTIKIKKLQEMKRVGFKIKFMENLEMNMWTLPGGSESKLKKVFGKIFCKVQKSLTITSPLVIIIHVAEQERT